MRRDAAALACVCQAAAAARLASKWRCAARVKIDGTVLEPAHAAFDVTVAPGEPVQAAVDRCPPGGCVLLLPGEHAGPVVLSPSKEVHVFGRGLAVLSTSTGEVLVSEAVTSTVDGLVIQRKVNDAVNDYAVWIARGGLRMQACDVTSASLACVCVQGGADPVLASCKCGTGA